MVAEVQYTSINRVLESLLDHPMLSDVSLEQTIRHTLRFIAKHGYNKLYQDKTEEIDIHEYRGVLPCDTVSIIQVKDSKTGICFRSMTDTFGNTTPSMKPCTDPMNNMRGSMPYIPPKAEPVGDLTFKTQNRIMFTSIPEGRIIVAYKAIPVDENGFPLVIDNELYLDALEAYIKMKVFGVKFDQQKISANVLQQAQQDYAVAARLLLSEFTTPSISEMESLSSIWNTMIPKMREFRNGFKNLGDREFLKNH